MDKMQVVYDYLNKKGWVVLDDLDEQVELLAKDGNNENYLITASEIYGDARYVLRVNHASPFGLRDQVDYEYAVLQALRLSGVTPRPFYSDSIDAGDLGRGALLMEHLPGRALDVAAEYELVAEALAAVHSQPVDECLISKVSRDGAVITHGAPFVSDFIVSEEGDKAWLVDWENCAIASRYDDLAFFLRDATLPGEAEHRFIESYVGMVDGLSVDEAVAGVTRAKGRPADGEGARV